MTNTNRDGLNGERSARWLWYHLHDERNNMQISSFKKWGVLNKSMNSPWVLMFAVCELRSKSVQASAPKLSILAVVNLEEAPILYSEQVKSALQQRCESSPSPNSSLQYRWHFYLVTTTECIRMSDSSDFLTSSIC